MKWWMMMSKKNIMETNTHTPFTLSSNTPYSSSHYSPSTMTTRLHYQYFHFKIYFYLLSLLKDP